MIPDGDRRHGSESGCVVHEVPPLVRNENIVSVLVLGEDAFHGQRWPNGAPPGEDALECGLFRDGARESVPQSGIEVRVVDQRNITHEVSPLAQARGTVRASHGQVIEVRTTHGALNLVATVRDVNSRSKEPSTAPALPSTQVTFT